MPRTKGAPLSEAELAQRRAAAVRANENATGPVTRKGKNISSMNAWKTGATANSARASMVGKPCQSTCSKYDKCVFIKAEKTKAGGKCLDAIDWSVVEEGAEAIIEAQQGHPEKLQGLGSLLMGQSVAVLQMMFLEVQKRGVWLVEDVFNAEGEVIGTRERENPMIDRISKVMDKLGFNLAEFLATPQSQAKVRQDDDAQQTAAEFTRQISRLIPSEMRLPAFDASEITDAEVVDDGK